MYHVVTIRKAKPSLSQKLIELLQAEGARYLVWTFAGAAAFWAIVLHYYF